MSAKIHAQEAMTRWLVDCIEHMRHHILGAHLTNRAMGHTRRIRIAEAQQDDPAPDPCIDLELRAGRIQGFLVDRVAPQESLAFLWIA
jgi:hypothetical protein